MLPSLHPSAEVSYALSRDLPLMSPRTPGRAPEAVGGRAMMRSQTNGRVRRGFTVLELMAVITIISVMSSLGWVRLSSVLDHAKVARAIGDMAQIAQELQSMDTVPASLAVIKRANLLDPWGHPYVYLPFPPDGTPPSGARLDQFNVPINSRYDLYSLGPDGQSIPPLSVSVGRDDIVVGNDGGFIGRATDY